MQQKTIGILTGGGDCAGLNAVIASIVKAGIAKDYRFVGFEKGLEGILNPVLYRPLDLDAVRGISHQGGTILRSTNHGRFAGKVGQGAARAIPPEILQQAKENLAGLEVDGLIVIGGDGTLSAAQQLSQVGVNIIGVPKTIDNDLSATDRTFGFSSAVDVAVNALDNIHTTAASHERVFLVECMGRHAGWVTLHAGLAANANALLLPEFPVDVSALIAFLERRISTRGSAIVAVAEGIVLDEGQNDGSGISTEVQLQGASANLMHRIEHLVPHKFEMRNVVLGHTQRGGSPNAQDRILAKRYGVAALEAYESGTFNHMVRLNGDRIETVPIADATGVLKRVTKEDPLYQIAAKLGVYVNS